MGVGLYVSVRMMGSMFMSDSVCRLYVCQGLAEAAVNPRGAHVARLGEIHNNLSDVLNVTTVIYGRHYAE